jgi:hypothetical protein
MQNALFPDLGGRGLQYLFREVSGLELSLEEGARKEHSLVKARRSLTFS